jgi:hypothetical protein
MTQEKENIDTCSDCAYWGPNHYMIDPLLQKGSCLHNSPQLDQKTGHGEWPLTRRRDWCAMFYNKANDIDTKQL